MSLMHANKVLLRIFYPIKISDSFKLYLSENRLKNSKIAKKKHDSVPVY